VHTTRLGEHNLHWRWCRSPNHVYTCILSVWSDD